MQLDFVGLACPMPVLKLKKYLAEHAHQNIDVELVLSDKGSLKDIPAFCQQKGLKCTLIENASNIVFKIEMHSSTGMVNSK